MILNGIEVNAKTLLCYAMQAVVDECGEAGDRFAQRIQEIHDDLRMREKFLSPVSEDGLQSVREIVQAHCGVIPFVNKHRTGQGLHLIGPKEGPDAA